MSPLLLAALALAAAATAAISAVTGVAGGVLLLSVLLLALDPRAVVPVHATAQLVANGSRIVAFRQHVVWPVVFRYLLAVVPGTVCGTLLVGALPARGLQLLIAAGILASLLPRSTAKTEQAEDPSPALFYAIGFASGLFGMLVGSTGPLVSAGLLHSGVVKERHIATKAVCQAFGHGLKLPMFGMALGFDFAQMAPLLAALSLAVVVGTLAGRAVLSRLSTETFVRATRVLLVLVAAKIVVLG